MELTPVVRVRGRGSGRVSMAGMVCYKPGARSRCGRCVPSFCRRRHRLPGLVGEDDPGAELRRGALTGGDTFLPLIYAIREYKGRKDQPKGFGWRDLRDLLVRARVQLGGPIVLVWDNVRLHLTAGMREFIAGNAQWLTVFQLPSYAAGLAHRTVSGRSLSGRSAISPLPTSGRSPGA